MTRETTPGLSRWADIVVALALVSCLPASSGLLPWAAVFVLLPHWLDHFRMRSGRQPEIVFVPDPLRPDWRALASCLGAAARLAAAERREVRLLLCTARSEDGRPLSYTIAYLPGRQALRVQAGKERHEVKLAWRLRPAMPLPIDVVAQAVPLLLAPMARRRTLLLAAPDGRAAARSVPLALLATALAAAWSLALGVVAALVACARLAALRASGESLGWWPWRGAVTGVGEATARMPALAGFDGARIWVGGLWLLRYAAGEGSALRSLLHDPLRLYGWGLLLPLMLVRGVRLLLAGRRAPAARD